MGELVSTQSNGEVSPKLVINDEEDSGDNQYLTFMAGNELYAMGIRDIKEIIEYRTPTLIPMMPDHISGIINLRGRVVPVIDLMARFGRKSSKVSRRTCIVIIEVNYDEELQYLGIIVDAVTAVIDISQTDVEPAPSFGAKLRRDFISGMGKIDEKFVIILEIDRVLSIDELSVLSDFDPEADPTKDNGSMPALVHETQPDEEEIENKGGINHEQ